MMVMLLFWITFNINKKGNCDGSCKKLDYKFFLLAYRICSCNIQNNGFMYPTSHPWGFWIVDLDFSFNEAMLWWDIKQFLIWEAVVIMYHKASCIKKRRHHKVSCSGSYQQIMFDEWIFLRSSFLISTSSFIFVLVLLPLFSKAANHSLKHYVNSLSFICRKRMHLRKRNWGKRINTCGPWLMVSKRRLPNFNNLQQ